MAMARAQLVDVSRWYHCVTRCVRRAFVLGEGDHKERLESRLDELAGIKLIDYAERLFLERTEDRHGIATFERRTNGTRLIAVASINPDGMPSARRP